MSDDMYSKTPPSPVRSQGSAPNNAAFREQVRRDREMIAAEIEVARTNSDVPALLHLLINEIVLWTRELKMETFSLFMDTEDGHFARQMMRNTPPHLSILPGYVVLGFMVAPDAYDLVELAVGEAQAQALSRRLSQFEGLKREFGESVARLASTWDDKPGGDVEQLWVIDRQRSNIKHAAFDLCRYIETLAHLAAARNGNTDSASAASLAGLQELSVDVADVGTDGATDRLVRLRRTFDSAVKRLDSIPDTELSPSGQPFVRECAEAMLAFAAWFGEQTIDDVTIHGNAYRVEYALSGLSGVIDWIGLHWSVPFANEIEGETCELVEQADAFDKAVVKAYRVPGKPHELRLRRKPLSDRTYNDLEQRIGQISALAARLGSRLQRVAVWALQSHSQTPLGQGAMRNDTSAAASEQPKVKKLISIAVPNVILGQPGQECRVLGEPKGPLTDGQYAVVAALINAGQEGLTKDGLELVRSSARRMLKDLRRDEDWAQVILMPGQTNGRYRIRQ